jgi:hypothetical protein
MRTRCGAGVSIPTTDGAEIEALAGSNPSFAAWEQNEPYTIALLIKGRSGGASTKHLYRSGTSSTGDHILWLASGTTPNLRHQASGGGTVTITSSVAIVNDTTWSTIVGTWRPGRLELYVDGFSRASSTAVATNTSASFGIYRWGWGFSTSQDFNGDIALIACFASSWTRAMVRRWHVDPFGFLRPWGDVPALIPSAHPPRPPRPARACWRANRSRLSARATGTLRAPPPRRPRNESPHGTDALLFYRAHGHSAHQVLLGEEGEDDDRNEPYRRKRRKFVP